MLRVLDDGSVTERCSDGDDRPALPIWPRLGRNGEHARAKRNGLPRMSNGSTLRMTATIGGRVSAASCGWQDDAQVGPPRGETTP